MARAGTADMETPALELVSKATAYGSPGLFPVNRITPPGSVETFAFGLPARRVARASRVAFKSVEVALYS